MSKKIKKQSKPFAKKKQADIKLLLNEAISSQQANQLQKAADIYKKILHINPKQPMALNFLGVICQQKGDFDAALKYALRAVKEKKDAAFLANLGSAYRGSGLPEKALEAFRRSLSIKPDLVEAQFNLACTFADLHEYDKAAENFRKILVLKPRMIQTQEGLGQALHNLGDFVGAIACFDQIIEKYPTYVNAFIHKALALQSLKKDEEALSLYRFVLEIDSKNAAALNNIGNILGQQGKLHESLSYYIASVRHKPDFIAANTNLAMSYLQHGMLPESLDCYRQLLSSHPNTPEIYSDLLFNMNYDPSLSPQELYEAATQWWTKYRDNFPPPLCSSGKSRPDPAKHPECQPPRIGFVSPDFRKHPVGTFIKPLLAELQNSDIETFCYAEISTANEDELTRTIKEYADHWYQTCGKSDKTVAEKIASDQIDILIDLAGHSAHNRMTVLARKPAPIQVNWLGYVNTTGLPTIDYRLTDAEADPPGAESHYAEALIRMPHGFFCYTPPANSPEIGELPARQAGHVTFGSFNNLVKISEDVIKVWAQILQNTPNSQLVMVSRPLIDKYIRKRYLDIFGKYGVPPNRLEMHGHLPTQEYLAMHNKIDIALDPFPHNGHTITCHTLWMGVPVITLRGNRYAARMGASILSRVSLTDLIAENTSDYVNKASNLALDSDLLSRLRSTMRERLLASPMCDSKQFALDFRYALDEMRRD